MLFRPERCTRCGECFTRCPYLDLTRAEAVREIERLLAGEPTRSVMQKCISCYSCDAFCPEGARPYGLILERWARRYRERGLPARASYMLPYQQPNYREDLAPEMSAREHELLAQWRRAPEAAEMLYPGCNLLTLPGLWDLPALRELPVSGDWSLCCGEPFFRLGAFEVVERIAQGLTRYYAGKKIRKLVFLCPACLNMFRTVLPESFGAKFEFECEYFGTWLWRRLEAGAIAIPRPLCWTVAIHDSCQGRILGDEVMEQTRALYRRLGLSLLNPKRHHQDGICCGIAAGCNRQMPQDIVAVGRRALGEGAATGCAEMAVYCTGCYLHLGIIQHLARTRQKLVHTLEFLAEAAGERVERVLEARTRKMLANIILKPLPKLLSSRRCRVEEITIGSEPGNSEN